MIRGVQWLVAVAAVASVAGVARAGAPEYMKLDPRVGLGVEVQGELNADGIFVASDIETLESARRPKFRGEVTAVDADRRSVTMFGWTIELTGRTAYIGTSAENLRPGRRYEIKCRVEDGRWSATDVEGGDIKDSNKIKGTITRVAVDGAAPDTLFIEGFPVLLVEDTDLAAAAVAAEERQYDLFDKLGLADAGRLRRGWAMADDRLGLRVQYRQQLRDQKNLELTDTYDADVRDTRPELKARAYVYASDAVRGLVDMRLRLNYTLSSDQDLPNGDAEFQLRQAYVLWRDIAHWNLGLSIGRQRIKEQRQWLWDEYLGAARLTWYGAERFTCEVTWIDPVNPLKEKFETWRDLYVAAAWQPAADNTITAYVMRRWDSDETRNREPRWWGLRYLGEPVRHSVAWVDLALMRGTDKHRPLRAWAVDVGGNWRVPGLPWKTSLTAAWAFGSGDEHNSPETDGEFRQTGYEDNTMRLGGLTGARYYGALLDPELSNLAIGTLGIGVRPATNFSCEVLYHRYRQDWSENDVRGNLVDPPARPNGISTDIGWETDLILSVRNVFNAVKASWTLAVFTPGEAYSPRRDRAMLNKLNFTVEI